MISVGPDAWGRFHPEALKRFEVVGRAISMKWPGEALTLESVRAPPSSRISILGDEGHLSWSQDDEGLVIQIPARLQPEASRPSEHAYVFKIEQGNYN